LSSLRLGSANPSDRGDAYRLGGDEVGLIIQDCPREKGITIVRNACLLLQQERLQFHGKELSPVSIAAGLIVTDTPSANAEQLRREADMSMYKAKEFTKTQSPRPSSLNVGGEEAVQLFN